MVKRTRIYALISWAILFLAMVLLGSKTTYQSDDYSYHFFYTARDGYDAVPFNNFFLEVVPSMVNHWYTCNGRFFAHTIVQLIMQGPHFLFVVLNAFVFVVMVALVLKLAQAPMKAGTILLTGAMAFLLMPIFGQTALWVSGSINYMWMGVVQLIFILLFIKWAKLSELEKGHGLFAILLMMAIFVGNSQMHGGPVVFMDVSFWVLRKWRRNRLIVLKTLLLDGLGIVGFALNYFAVGSSQRVTDLTGGIFTINHVMNYFDYTKPVWPLFAVMLFMFVIGSVQYGLKVWLEKLVTNHVTVIMLVAAATALAVMFCTADLATRTLFPVYLFNFVVLLTMIGSLKRSKVTQCAFGLVTVAAVVMFSAANMNLDVTHEVDTFNTERMIKALPHESVSLKFNYVPNPTSGTLAGLGYLYNPMTGLYRLSTEETGWVNRWAATYYGVESVKIDDTLGK